MKSCIKAILFDSGKVLNTPKSGNWFISPRFFEYVDPVVYYQLSKKMKQTAFQQAYKYINTQPLIVSQEQEFSHFLQFYQIMADNLPQLRLSMEQVQNLAFDLVYNTDKYIFYADARVIPELSEKYKLGIISDAWPSLREVYIKANLYPYFSTFVISSILGISKPDRRMYEAALKELNIEANGAIFIDDNLGNCIGAMKVGLTPVLLCRNKALYCIHRLLGVVKGYSVIYSLDQIAGLKIMR